MVANKGEYWAASSTARTNLPPDIMDFTRILKELQESSAFDIYRLSAAINRVLDQPGWIQAVQSRLRVGQNIEYFDTQTNRTRKGQVLEMRRKQAVVLDIDRQQRWLISYAAINLDGADVEIREQPQQGLGRNSVAVGDVVGFVDKHHQQRSGEVVRLNDKTVTLLVGQQQWRVSYGLLHRVVDGRAENASEHELSYIAGEAAIIDNEE